MKIFNEENGVKKVYVQVNDLSTIQEFDEDVPLYMYDVVYGNEDATIDKNHGMSFLSFERPEEVEYFKNCDWIFDYKQYRDFSVSQLQDEKEKIQTEIDGIFDSLAGLSIEERKAKKQELARIYLLTYKKGYFDYFINYKKGFTDINFPDVVDGDSFVLTGGKDFPYELKTSIDPNKVYIYRKDGQYLVEGEPIPENFIVKGESIVMTHKHSLFNEGEYEIVRYFGGDGKTLVIEFRSKKKEQDKKQEEKGIMKLVHKLFKNYFTQQKRNAFDISLHLIMVPTTGFEPVTYALRGRCTTTVLNRLE